MPRIRRDMRLLSALSGSTSAMSHRHRAFSPLFAPLLRLMAAAVLAGTITLQSDHLWAQSSSPAADGNAEVQNAVETLESSTMDDVAPGANRDFPWWPWILAFPALGGLLWWLLRYPRSKAEPALPIADQMGEGAAGAVATGLSNDAQNSGLGPGGSSLGGKEEQTPPTLPRRMILVPCPGQTAYAYWELPIAEVEALTQSSRCLSLALHDVTDRAPVHPPTPQAILPCPTEAMGDLHLSLPQADRDYWVELGYADDDSTWHSLAQSAPVRASAQSPLAGAAHTPPPVATVVPVAPAEPTAEPTTTTSSSANLNPSPEESRVAAAAIPRPSTPAARATLTPQTCRSVEARWEISPEQVADLRIGNRRLTVRLYDVTELPGSFASNLNRVQEFEAELMPQANLTLPIVMDDRDYLVEVGYLTGSGQWQVLAKSSPVRVPNCDDTL